MIKIFVERLNDRTQTVIKGQWFDRKQAVKKGEWFDLPVDLSLIRRKLELYGGNEEYMITDYESPFPIGEYDSLQELNELAELLEELSTSYKNNLAEIKDAFFSDIREAIENHEDITHLSDVYNDRDYGNYMIEEGLFEVPERLRSYIDKETLGRDYRFEGNIIYTDDGAFYK